jgi:hypothetical protein
MNATNMREMMFAAGLVLAACGDDLVEPPSDAGTEEVGTWGALTIDSSEHVVDGTRWWTNTSAPTLRGLFVASVPVTIEIEVGGAAVPATIDGTTWSAKLPPDAIGSGGTEVKAVMTNAIGERVVAMQTLVLDDRAPAIAMLPSLVLDERGDKIDFSSGEPVHSHLGPEIALDALDCTAVYKYAYFMFASPQPLGAETTPNPLRYVFWIDDTQVDARFTAFRVRTPEDSVLRDWTALAPIGWHYVVPLYADEAHAVPELAKRSGKYLVDVRARDWAGRVSTATWCFDLQLLAPPMK